MTETNIGRQAQIGSLPQPFPDVPFLVGIGSHNWHAVPKDSLAYLRTGPADSVTFASCGDLVRVAPKFGAYDRGKSPVTYSPCQPCAWTVAAAGGMAALQVEAARLGPTSEEVDRLAKLLPDPFLAVNACRAILAEFEDDDEPDNPAALQLLATIAAHAPALLVSEECGDGDCEHDEGACPSSTVACIACSLVVGDWAGEWQGQLRPECTVKAPCAVLLALAGQSAADHIPVSPQDLRRLTLLALPVTREDDEFVQRMTAAWEGGQ